MGRGNSTSVSLVINGREMRQQFISFSYIMLVFNVCQDRCVARFCWNWKLVFGV